MSLAFVICAAVFGGAAASFLPRIADRLAVAFGTPPRSSCAACDRPFEPGVPGWLHTGAPCRCTARRVASLGIIAAGAAAATLLSVRLGPSPRLPIYLVATVPGLLLALIDLRCLRLPDRVVGALAIAAGVPLTVLTPYRLGFALLAAAALVTAYGMIAALPGAGLGLGDVKLAAVLGLILGFAGWPVVLAGVLAAHLINGSIALFLLVTGRATGKRALPFGPALLAGALLALTAA